MKQQPGQYEDDDGRVICSMDVEGLRHKGSIFSGKLSAAQTSRQSAALPSGAGQPISRSEARLYTVNALLAGLLIASVFAITWILFTLFCIKIWFA